MTEWLLRRLSLKSRFYLGPIGLLLVLLVLFSVFYFVGNANKRIWQEVSSRFHSVQNHSNETITQFNALNQLLLQTLLLGDVTLNEEDIYIRGTRIIDQMDSVHQQLNLLLVDAKDLIADKQNKTFIQAVNSLKEAFSSHEITIRSATEMSTVDIHRADQFALTTIESGARVNQAIHLFQSVLAECIHQSIDHELSQYNYFYNVLWLAMLLLTSVLFLLSFHISKSTAGLLEHIHHELWNTARSVSHDASPPIQASTALSIAQIKSTVDIFSKLTLQLEQQRQMIELEHAASQSANRAKTAFLSSMSHELRTPLNSILGFSELLATDRDHPPTQEQLESLQYIISSGQHLLKLVEDVLNLSKIEAGRIEISLDILSVNTLISEVCQMVRSQAEQQGISINNTVIANPALTIKADDTKIKQVLLNIITNAIKYNNKNGMVTISADDTDEGHVRISVSDQGNAVPEALFPQLFEPFNRLDKANSTIEGTGIGLSITKKLVELMGGSIGVYRNTDQGMTFWIKLKQV